MERLQRAAARAHIFLQGNIPLAWMLGILVACSAMSQVMILMLGPGLEFDEATNHWHRFRHHGQQWRAPAIVFEVATCAADRMRACGGRRVHAGAHAAACLLTPKRSPGLLCLRLTLWRACWHTTAHAQAEHQIQGLADAHIRQH